MFVPQQVCGLITSGIKMFCKKILNDVTMNHSVSTGRSNIIFFGIGVMLKKIGSILMKSDQIKHSIKMETFRRRHLLISTSRNTLNHLIVKQIILDS